MNTKRMVELALERAVHYEQVGDMDRANHFLQLAITAEEKGNKEEERKDGN
ncbi:unnamed protein product [marine sediment metagenome]|uniref:Uncharacterized protein n=1 Tax=marine sediment metagenome TaxID=412755 RepID=X1R493_9ZZZZ